MITSAPRLRALSEKDFNVFIQRSMIKVSVAMEKPITTGESGIAFHCRDRCRFAVRRSPRSGSGQKDYEQQQYEHRGRGQGRLSAGFFRGRGRGGFPPVYEQHQFEHRGRDPAFCLLIVPLLICGERRPAAAAAAWYFVWVPAYPVRTQFHLNSRDRCCGRLLGFQGLSGVGNLPVIPGHPALLFCIRWALPLCTFLNILLK